jgi:Short C-terminal domain
MLRFEMLSGVTVMGQAKKCREFEDRLRSLGITSKFKKAESTAPSSPAADDIPAQIRKLAELRDQGILSEDEFTAKKTELLSRL